MAWIVNEDNLADMYLNLDGEGGAYDFNEGMLEAGVVHIRKYKKADTLRRMQSVGFFLFLEDS